MMDIIEMINIEKKIKDLGLNILRQDIRFTVLYFKYFNNKSSENSLTTLLEDLLYCKVLYTKLFNEFFYFDLKKEYFILRKVISKIAKEILEINSVNFNIKKIFDFLNLEKFDEIECVFINEIDIKKKFIGNFYAEILDIIKDYCEDKISNSIKNNLEFEINLKKNSNDFIDLN